ncbi:hypothetical protein MRB53_015016 [Persea americana]|uniref:Uncharacterized protein n=1 Tax=Persea americana TaxID=3435 RepID=A0ACC2KCJ1_PERAE|nr:hypothetical protein MRB53_015016 [Persea americana]
MEIAVVIVGAGPSGIATSACLNLHSISNIVLEREDCSVSLWRKRAYNRLNLHLAKEFCQLPHMPYPPNAPTFLPKKDFINYIDDYVAHFNVIPIYRQSVESARYDATIGRWRVEAKDTCSGKVEEYIARFLVVATGENSEGFIPEIPGLDTFSGDVIHSSQFKSGKGNTGKVVLVVGSGNSGMEIAYDLSNYGAVASIVIRNPTHIVAKEMVHLAMVLLKVLPLSWVDSLTLIHSRWKFGDLSNYGIRRPKEGPFFIKATEGRSPVLDVGTVGKIKTGEMKVQPALKGLKGNEATFANGEVHCFDAIVFATGYRSTAKRWLKDEDDLLNKDGMPRLRFPSHWKGKKGLYCAGFSSRGLAGVAIDARMVAEDIIKVCMEEGLEPPLK